MPPHRLALALAVGCLAVVAGLGTCALAPEGSASEISELAVASLGVEVFLALVALAGGLLSRRSLAARLGLEPSRISCACLALLVLGTLGVSHGLDGLLELSGLRERSALADFDEALAGAGGRAARHSPYPHSRRQPAGRHGIAVRAQDHGARLGAPVRRDTPGRRSCSVSLGR